MGDVPEWLEWIMWSAGAVTALGVLWQKVIRPAARGISNTERMLPVLVEIADKFRPNGGSTLHDRIVKIEANVEEVRRMVEAIKREIPRV